jgi:hypothetical protein
MPYHASLWCLDARYNSFFLYPYSYGAGKNIILSNCLVTVAALRDEGRQVLECSVVLGSAHRYSGYEPVGDQSLISLKLRNSILIDLVDLLFSLNHVTIPSPVVIQR